MNDQEPVFGRIKLTQIETEMLQILVEQRDQLLKDAQVAANKRNACILDLLNKIAHANDLDGGKYSITQSTDGTMCLNVVLAQDEQD